MSEPNIIDEVETFLHELDGWERAYPVSAFPEPDMMKAAEVLKAAGLTLDAISASNMRHVVSCIAPKARTAIAALTSSRDQVIEEAFEANINGRGPKRIDSVAELLRLINGGARFDSIRSLKVQPDKGLLEGGSA